MDEEGASGSSAAAVALAPGSVLLSTKTVCTLWQELVHELRFHFETSLPIPRLLSGDTPEFGWSILHQKVQLLQRCIRIKREKSRSKASNNAQGTAAKGEASPAAASRASSDDAVKSTPDWQNPWTTWSEEKLASGGGSGSAAATTAASASAWGSLDDLGFGEETGDASPAANTVTGAASSSGWGELDLSVSEAASDNDDEDDEAERALSDAHSRPPLGVASELPVSLLLVPAQPLRVPVTQEVRVMTSDQFDAQNELMARLGTGPEAARLRTEMQTASLSSDMQAFKAANPGCILEDFVRWHSPKDWRPAAQGAAANANANAAKRGELSQRMRKRSNADSGSGAGGHIWHSLWKSASPVPASEQTPLFDPLLEGEHVLSWLENVEPSLLFAHLQGIALQNCIGLLARTRGVAEGLQPVQAAIQRLHHYLKNFNRGSTPADLHADVALAELTAAKATSLLLCLPPQPALAPQPTAAAAKPTTGAAAASAAKASNDAAAGPPSSGREMLAHLLHSGSYLVGSSVPERAALTALLSGSSPRSKPPSLFRAPPFSYNPPRATPNGNGNGGGAALDSAGSGPTLPKPDWSEHTFFAPHAGGVPGVGSRTYICQRHTAQTQGGTAPQHKVRICTSMLLQTE